MEKFTNLELLYYAVKILIVLAQTSELPYHFKETRVQRLEDIRKELGNYYD